MYEALGEMADVASTDEEAAAWRTMAEVGPKMNGPDGQITATRDEVVASIEASNVVRDLAEQRCGIGLP